MPLPAPDYSRAQWLAAAAATALAVPLGALVLAGSLYAAWASADLPPVSAAPQAGVPLATVVYARGGEELARYYRENRTWTPHDAIAPVAVQALIATEDHRFYAHGGIDAWRLVSAAVQTAGGDRQGASTLTMQLARNRYPSIGDAPPLERKVKELLMARRLEARYAKPEIAEAYLNTVPFGRRAFGIASAAHVYFGTTPARLDTAQAATLVGLLKATSRYNPVAHPERARRRRNVVLRQMQRRGIIEEAAYQRLRRRPLGLDVQTPGLTGSPAPHFAEHVRRWAEAWAARTGHDLYTDGLRIHTTLDAGLQRTARQAVRAELPALEAVAGYEWSRRGLAVPSEDPATYEAWQADGRFQPFSRLWTAQPDLRDALLRRTPRYRRAVRRGTPVDTALMQLRRSTAVLDSLRSAHARLEAGFVALDPANGAVRAWVGGRAFAADQYDHVALAKRQPGSTFKPFVYAAAIDHGYAPQDVMRGGRVRPVRPAAPSQDTDADTSTVSLADGLAWSSNRLALQLTRAVGPSQVARMAERLGVESRLRAVPSLALGTSEVTLLEMASAYATLAARGTYHPPRFVTRVEDRHGRRLATVAPEGKKVLSMYTAYTVLDMMRGVVDRGTAAPLRRTFGVAADVAGKTGTTQNNADGWFLAAHPDLVAGAWVGFNDRRIHFRSEHWGHGSSNALRLVGHFLKDALATGAVHSDARFVPPPGYRPPRPLPARPTTDRPYRLTGEPGADQSLRDAFAHGLDSTTARPSDDPLLRRDADPESALRESVRVRP